MSCLAILNPEAGSHDDTSIPLAQSETGRSQDKKQSLEEDAGATQRDQTQDKSP
ncbi:hypothetical protein HMPREF1235_1461 [Streptococcus pyogenes GA41208]|nr:hypothetical protein HMPREF1235_1461 [Streptococcus pyogenes GA41208]